MATSFGAIGGNPEFPGRRTRVRGGCLLMYVCLCVGATNQTVCDAVARGASTSKEIAAACGAGGDCGRCRRTLRAILASAAKLDPAAAVG